jgi:hypothetical protein
MHYYMVALADWFNGYFQPIQFSIDNTFQCPRNSRDILVQRISSDECVIGSLSKRDDAHSQLRLAIGDYTTLFCNWKNQPNVYATMCQRFWLVTHHWVSYHATLATYWLRKYFKATSIGLL